MADLATIGFKADIRDLTRAVRELEKVSVKGAVAEKSASGLGKAFVVLAGAVGATVAAMASMSKIVDVTRQFDVLNAQLITATGSAKNAAIEFKAIQAFAASTPFDLGQVTDAFTKLVNLGLTPSQKAMESYGNTASAMGKDLTQLIEAVADAATGEFERLKEFGIKTKSEGDNVSFTFRGVSTTVKKEASAIEGYLTALGENNFAGSMANRMSTLDGAISNLGDEWDKLFLNLSQRGIGSAMESGVRMAIGALEELNIFIASGQIEGNLNLLKLKFSGFTEDISSGLSSLGKMLSSEIELTLDVLGGGGDLLSRAFKRFPENMRSIIQLAGVEIAVLVDYAREYGSAFAEVLGIEISKFVSKAGAYGRAIAIALNPFTTAEFDLEAELKRLGDVAAEMTDEIFSRAESGARIIADARKQSILDIMAVHEAALAAADAEALRVAGLRDSYLAANGAVAELGSTITKVLEEEVKAVEGLDASLAALIDKVDGFGGAWSSTGNVIVDAFGDASDALDDFSKRMVGINKLQAELNEKRATYADGSENALMADKALAKLNQESNRAQIAGLRTIIGTTSSLFKENSKERKALHALEMGFMAVEIAMAAEKAIANAVAAVANQGSGDPYSAFGRIAAMIGIMGGVLAAAGIAFGAGGGGGYSAPSSGTGTVLGDSSSESASIANSFELFEDIQIDQLAELRGIRAALTGLSSGIERLATSFVTGIDFAGGDVSGLGTVKTGLSGGGIPSLLGRMFGAGGGSGLADPILSSIIGSFSSTKTKLVGSGVEFLSQTLGQILDSGSVGANLFNVIETTKKSFWGLTKKTGTSTTQAAIDQSIADQMGSIFGFIADSVGQAAASLGIDSIENIEKMLQGFNLNLGKIDFKDMTGDEIEEKLQAIFSQQADLIASSIVPALSQFQKMGEGTFETLQRIAFEQAVFNDNLARTGMSLNGLSSMMQIEVAQAIITMIGGLENFTSATNEYFSAFFSEQEQMAFLQNSLAEAMASIGKPLVSTREEFRAMVEALDLTTESGQMSFAALMQLVPAMDQYLTELEKQQAEITRLTDKAARAAAKSSLDTAKEAFSLESGRLNAARASLEQEKTLRDKLLSQAETALRGAVTAEINGINEAAQARLSALSDEKSAIESNIASLLSLSQRLDQRIGGGVTIEAALNAARRGDFSLAEQLSPQGITGETFGSSAQLAIAQAVQANQLQSISGLAATEAARQGKNLSGIDRQIAATESAAKAQIDALNNQLAGILGIDAGVMSVSDAIEQYREAQLSLDQLNYEAELSKLDLLVMSNNEVYALHQAAYAAEIERLDLLVNSGIIQAEALQTIASRPAEADALRQENQALRNEVAEMRREAQDANLAIAKNTATTARLLQRVVLDGIEIQ